MGEQADLSLFSWICSFKGTKSEGNKRKAELWVFAKPL